MTDVLDRIWLSQAEGADLSEDGILFVAFAGCSLDEKPGSNWVQDVGGLPEYICRIARAIKRSGHDTSSAIRLAVGTVKNWASGQKHVDAATRAKAAAAVSEWEAKRAAAHGRKAAKKTVEASGEVREFISLCAETFNTEVVNDAWRGSELRLRMFPTRDTSGLSPYADSPYSYIVQLWSNFIIATGDLDNDHDTDYYKIPYSVDPADQNTVTFGTPVEVQQQWVTVDGEAIDGSDDLDGSDLTDDDLDSLMDLSRSDALDKLVALASEQKRGDNPSSASTSGPYADPKNKKYPIDTADRVRSAWSYINNPKNASVYPLNGVTLSSVKAKIKAAAAKFDVEISDSSS